MSELMNPGNGSLLFSDSTKLPGRVVIENVHPEIQGGRFPVKRVVGDRVLVSGDIFTDGHEALSAVILFRAAHETGWHEAAMQLDVNDRWTGTFRVDELGRYEYTI